MFRVRDHFIKYCGNVSRYLRQTIYQESIKHLKSIHVIVGINKYPTNTSREHSMPQWIYVTRWVKFLMWRSFSSLRNQPSDTTQRIWINVLQYPTVSSRKSLRFSFVLLDGDFDFSVIRNIYSMLRETRK